jgi:hypothetical protein
LAYRWERVLHDLVYAHEMRNELDVSQLQWG